VHIAGFHAIPQFSQLALDPASIATRELPVNVKGRHYDRVVDEQRPIIAATVA
jgi:hypothetical protein